VPPGGELEFGGHSTTKRLVRALLYAARMNTLLTRSLALQLVRALRVGFVAGLVGGCAPPGESFDDAGLDDEVDDASAISLPTRYVAIEDALGRGERRRWEAVRTRLFEQFDEICGDTFCGGDWSNLYPLQLACSASAIRGSVRECVWTFGASEEVVEAAGGDITSSIPVFACRFRPQGNARDLVAALADDPLWAPLPGGDPSVYDQLGDCFETPIGAEPLPDESLDGPYVDVSDGLEDGAIDAWYAMTSGLRSAYGATASRDASAPRPLRFRCSEDENTRTIGSCAWMFAEAEPKLLASGLHRVIADRHVCSFRSLATPAELAAALGPLPAADVDPLDRPIPGGEATLRDVLDACW
jgi:hypothetical protein